MSNPARRQALNTLDLIDDARDAYRAMRAVQDLMILDVSVGRSGQVPTLAMVGKDDFCTLLGIVNSHLDHSLTAASESVQTIMETYLRPT